MKFFTTYNVPPKVRHHSDLPSKTMQQFAEDADINVLINRFNDPQRPLHPEALQGPRYPMFGDFSQVPDLAQSHDLWIQAEESFASLPVHVRERFGYDPRLFLAFVENPANRDEVKQMFGETPAKVSAVPSAPSVSSVNSEVLDAEPTVKA